MARLVSYKRKDDNKYSTFQNENRCSCSGECLDHENEFQRVKIKKTTIEPPPQKKYPYQCVCCTKFWHKLCTCCCMCHYKCCCCCSCLSESIDIDDDIDRKFSQFSGMGEVQLQELHESNSDSIHDFEKSLSQRSTLRIEDRKPKSKYWNWNDSLRSNSDKFLETLEYDLDADRSLKRMQRNRLKKFYSYYNKEESNASTSSPIIGNRKEIEEPKSPAAQSSTTSTTDPWPSQADEDIDRLVALHQNRSSLSSLGLRSDSMASVYSGAGEGRYGTVIVKGQVEFGMQYNYKQGALEIHVVQCKDLAAVDSKRNRSDPYVKLYLLPDKSKTGKRKTKVKKHTLNPFFDETLKFHMSLNNLESRTLWLTVWHSDMFGRNDFLGEVTINLQGRVFDNPHPQWYLLQERSEPFDDMSGSYKGDIIVGLKYIPPDTGSSSSSHHLSGSGSGSLSIRKFGSIKSAPPTRSSSSKGALHVLVKEGKNLTAVKANGSCDAFCKSYLLPDRNRSSKQKTPVVKRTVNPVWNYTFIYDDVTLNELSERALELTIWDHDRLASNEFLGGVRFSLGTGKYYGKTVDWMDATGKELSLWQSMLNRPNFWVEGSVILRPSLDGNRFNS